MLSFQDPNTPTRLTTDLTKIFSPDYTYTYMKDTGIGSVVNLCYNLLVTSNRWMKLLGSGTIC